MADVVYRAEFDFNVIGGGDGNGETIDTGGDSRPSTKPQSQQSTQAKTQKLLKRSLQGLGLDTAMQVANTGISSYGSTISYATGNSYQQEKFQWGANIVKTMGSRVIGGAAAGAVIGNVPGAIIGASVGAISGGISIASSYYQAELKASFQREIDLMHLRQIRKVTGLSSMNNSRMISSSSLY